MPNNPIPPQTKLTEEKQKHIKSRLYHCPPELIGLIPSSEIVELARDQTPKPVEVKFVEPDTICVGSICRKLTTEQVETIRQKRGNIKAQNPTKK